MIRPKEYVNENTVRLRLKRRLKAKSSLISSLVADNLYGNFKFNMPASHYSWPDKRALKDLRFIVFEVTDLDFNTMYADACLEELRQLNCFEDLVNFACHKLDLEGRLIHSSRPGFLERRLEL